MELTVEERRSDRLPVTRLQAWRYASDLTLEDAAKRIDLDPTYLSRIERGVRRPSGRAMARIARRTGLGVRFQDAPEESA